VQRSCVSLRPPAVYRLCPNSNGKIAIITFYFASEAEVRDMGARISEEKGVLVDSLKKTGGADAPARAPRTSPASPRDNRWGAPPGDHKPLLLIVIASEAKQSRAASARSVEIASSRKTLLAMTACQFDRNLLLIGERDVRRGHSERDGRTDFCRPGAQSFLPKASSFWLPAAQ
jgi:hypothetical protein